MARSRQDRVKSPQGGVKTGTDAGKAIFDGRVSLVSVGLLVLVVLLVVYLLATLIFPEHF